MTNLSRRSLLGFIAAAPFIVRSASLMPVRTLLAGPMAPALRDGDPIRYYRSVTEAILCEEFEAVYKQRLDPWHGPFATQLA